MPAGLVLTLTKSRKSSEAAKPRAAALSCATCSKLVKRRGRRRTKRVHWRSAAPSWARRRRAAAAVSATSSHRAHAPGRAKRTRPSLRQARASATEKYNANSNRLTCKGGGEPRTGQDQSGRCQARWGRGQEGGAYRGEQRQREARAQAPQSKWADAEGGHSVSGRGELEAQRDRGVQPHSRAVACELHEHCAAPVQRQGRGTERGSETPGTSEAGPLVSGCVGWGGNRNHLWD